MDLSVRSPIALVTAIVVLLVSVVGRRLKRQRQRLSSLPDAGNNDYRTTSGLREGIKNYPNRPVKFTAPLFDKIILPARYANEIKDLPEPIASFEGSLHREFIGQYTGIGTHHAAMTRNLEDLNRHGNKVLNILQGEVSFATSKVLGDCHDWTPVPVSFQLMRVVALLSSRVFVGQPLCRDDEWVNMNISFLFNSFGGAATLAQYPWWLRPAAARFVREIRALEEDRAVATRLLRPVVEQRLRESAEGNFEEPADMIQWTLNNGGIKAENVQEHVEVQLALLSVSLLGTTILTTFVLYELAAHPECIPALREELERVLQNDNDELVKSSLPKLKKLDSFIKETQRLNVTTAVLLNRLVRKDCTLSDGTILPAGVDVAVNSMEVNMDASLWKDPDVFDGFRFEKLRNQPGAESKHQLVMASVQNISFGLGPQVCPGRFFAGTEIKVIISHIILNYDVKYKSDEVPPVNTRFGVEDVFIKPKQLLFKRRT